MRIFKTKLFHQWAIKSNLDDKTLQKTAKEIEQGQYEANLGGYLYKKRIAFGHKGKSNGLRTILAFRKMDKLFFVYGFAKNTKGNITQDELIIYKEMAKLLIAYDEKQIDYALKTERIIEIYYE